MIQGVALTNVRCLFSLYINEVFDLLCFITSVYLYVCLIYLIKLRFHDLLHTTCIRPRLVSLPGKNLRSPGRISMKLCKASVVMFLPRVSVNKDLNSESFTSFRILCVVVNTSLNQSKLFNPSHVTVNLLGNVYNSIVFVNYRVNCFYKNV